MKKRLFIGLAACLVLAAGYSFYGTTEAGNINLTQTTAAEETLQEDTIEYEVQLSLDSVGVYTGKPYVEVNGNVPYFTDAEKSNVTAFEQYSNLDALGRCGVAYANVCKELMPTEERGEIGNVRPSGWHTVNYHEYVDGNYLYNRCHLLGYQLTGENANEKNLITGTRYLNVVGMLPFENKIADYVKAKGNHVLYRVTPIFEDNNLVASGVLMEAYSVEDQGAGVCFNVYCYNAQPGIVIDYATGDSELSADATPVQNQAVSSPTTSEKVEAGYVLNTNTKRFHNPSCSSVTDMKEKNKQSYQGSRQDLINQGYKPCGRCNP